MEETLAVPAGAGSRSHRQQSASCHGGPQADTRGLPLVAIVGSPNVGKSVLFNALTGAYVTVSNYPGTTVEISRGAAAFQPQTEIIDTPGIVTLPSRTEDERVTARVLLGDTLRAIVQVGDAKNPRRTLLLTIQLAEMGVPLILALNMVDEASVRGIAVNCPLLSEALGLPVIPTVATRGHGLAALTAAVAAARPPALNICYPAAVEQAIAAIVPGLPAGPIAPRSIALLWLGGDAVVEAWLEERVAGQTVEHMRAIRAQAQQVCAEPLAGIIQQARLAFLTGVLPRTVRFSTPAGRGLATTLGRMSTHPLWGLPILAAVLYALYWFVGVLGAGVLVGWLEKTLFGTIVNPWVAAAVERLAPWPLLADLLVGQYGLWTMGMTYALALLLPIVTTFFIAFGVLEDSGYLPRLAALSNRAFTRIGLNGKAVLPMVLGLGCVTMATMTTRILDRRRDRLLVTLLLALATPCSAQLGVVLGILGAISLGATLIWAAMVLLVLLTAGWLAARLIPGERSLLLLELPPLRVPRPGNVLIKTAAHLEWYVKEAVPLFLLGPFLLWTMQTLGVLPRLIAAGEPLVTGWLGLPREASAAFLLGFLRRDFAATGLFALQGQGLLSARQAVVAMVTITLFVPCIASAIMIGKERGTRTAVAMVLLIFPLAFAIGGILERVLRAIGWGA